MQTDSSRPLPEITRQGRPLREGNIVFCEVDRFSCALDLGEGMEYTIRAALLNGVKQAGGDETDIGEYCMDVYSIAEDDQVLLAGFTVPQTLCTGPRARSPTMATTSSSASWPGG